MNNSSPRKIRKVVLPVAGLGTRFLPATKVIPKEMLTVVDKPVIQYAVEEAVEAGIEHFVFVTGRGKGAIEDHFDMAYELEATLKARGKTAAFEMLEGSRPVAGETNFEPLLLLATPVGLAAFSCMPFTEFAKLSVAFADCTNPSFIKAIMPLKPSFSLSLPLPSSLSVSSFLQPWAVSPFTTLSSRAFERDSPKGFVTPVAVFENGAFGSVFATICRYKDAREQRTMIVS